MTKGFTDFQQIFSIVQQINVTFGDDVGNSRNAVGTGFWVKSKRNKFLFITNRHNVDPLLKLENSYKLKELSIKYRFCNTITKKSFVKTFELKKNDEWKTHYLTNNDSPDVAAIEVTIEDINRQYEISDATLGCLRSDTFVPETLLADQAWFDDKLEVGDNCHFIGFPDIKLDNPMYTYPISRNCNLSSYPTIDYFDEHPKGVKTKDIVLVCGLSFGGSSGSAVFSYPKGINTDGTTLIGGNYVEPRLIGVMSGHWNEKDAQNLFAPNQHKGLSYFTRSTAILELIKEYQL